MNTLKTYLAIDYGASSGRAIAGTLKSNKIELTEVHRFANSMTYYNGSYFWDIYRLYDELIRGIAQSQKKGFHPVSLAVDTWGVDFALLDKNGGFIGIPYAYRDHRTDDAMENFFKQVPASEVYKLTGIQFMQFNSLFQLFAAKNSGKINFQQVHDLLFMPDILNYMLTGLKSTEFSFATTSQLFNPNAFTWEKSLFEALDIPVEIMQEIVMPGTILGNLSPALKKETGLPSLNVTSVASHDTGSAIAAIPATDSNFAYISSGTWSLMGIETDAPVINSKSFDYSFTNEGGVDKTFRVLKNIMGLWLIQECNRNWDAEGKEYSFPELVTMAEKEKPFRFFINPDESVFLNPENMVAAIREYCKKTNQDIPDSPGEIARTIFESLAFQYRYTLEGLREISDKKIERIHIIGGGSQNKLLCRFTANATGLPVIAGPAEGTALGNLMVQAKADGMVSNRHEMREIIRNSFHFEEYEPEDISMWNDAYARFREKTRS